MKSWAKQLGFNDAVSLLDQTLTEEKKADQTLSHVAESIANTQAGEGENEDADDEKKEVEDDKEAKAKLSKKEVGASPKKSKSKAA